MKKTPVLFLVLIFLLPIDIYGQNAHELQERVEQRIAELKQTAESSIVFPDGLSSVNYFNVLKSENDLDDIFITDIQVGINGDLWVLANGLIEPDGNTRKAFLTKFNQNWKTVYEFSFDDINSTFNLPFYVNSNGDVWFTDNDNLLKLTSGNELSIYNFAELGFSHTGNIVDIVEDQDGVVWMLTFLNRLLEFDDGELLEYDDTNSPMPYLYYNTSIYRENYLAVTNSGLWIAPRNISVDDKGVIRKQGDNWEVFTKENSDLPSNYVTGIVVQNPDHLWISTHQEINPDAKYGDDDYFIGGGLLEIKNDEWIVHNRETGLYANNTRVLTTESDKYVWLQFGDDSAIFDLLNNGIVANYDGNTWDKVLDENEIFIIGSLVVTDDELLWFASESELFTLNEMYLNFINKPLANRGYLSGDEIELTWNVGRKVESIKLEYKDDKRSEFKVIDTDIDAKDESYTYTFPEKLANGVQLKISDVDRPDVYDTTGHFSIFNPEKVKYHLRKEFPDNTVELFDPTVHGWNFGNTSENMWPISAWENRDDYTGVLAKFPFKGVKSDFPSWDMFEGAFGETVYTFGSIPSLTASALWLGLKSKGFQGTCHGFAISSLLAFTEGVSALTTYGVQTDKESLYDVPLAGDNRFLINKLWTQQWSKDHLLGIVTNALSDDFLEQLIQLVLNGGSIDDVQDMITDEENYVGPSETLELVKEMLERKNPGDYHKNITLINPDNITGAHSVVPYKVKKSPVRDIWYIYVYDNNFPGDNTKRITINTEYDVWQYIEKEGQPIRFEGSYGLFLGDSAEKYKTTSRILKENPENSDIRSQINSLDDIGYFYTLNSPNTNFSLTDKNSNIISLEDGVVSSDIPGSFPITPLVGGLADPMGYFLFKDNYDISLDYKEDQKEGNFTFVLGKTRYSFSNYEANQQDSDKLRFGEDLTIYTVGKNQNYRFDVSVIDENNSKPKMYNLRNTAISTEDSLSVIMQEDGDLVIDNYGGAGSLILEIKEALTEDFFFVENFSISESSTYKLSPDWDNLTGKNLIVQVDSDMDGTYDESFEVSSETPVSTEPKESSNTSAKFELHQNYPNPFNPTTNIGFNLPSNSHMELSIYNTLGQKVTTLVNNRMEAGSHTVNWDAKNMSSGVYLYKIQVGNYIETRKMVLMK